MVRIEQWAVIFVSGDEYTPPELRERALLGAVYGHPRFDEGEAVTTSSLIGGSVHGEHGHVVDTETRQYLLGEPSKAYLAWIEEKGIAFDPMQPVRKV
jgi:hypothetical protein